MRRMAHYLRQCDPLIAHLRAAQGDVTAKDQG